MIASPQEIRVTNNRKELARWRSHKKWKLLVKEHCHDNPNAVCIHCLRHHGDVRYNIKGKKIVTNLTINHISRTRYWSEELYCTWDEADMEICCTTCNWKIEAGEKPCPICKTTYIFWREYSCQKCWDKLHPAEAEKKAESKWKKETLWGLKKVLAKEANAVLRKENYDKQRLTKRTNKE